MVCYSYILYTREHIMNNIFLLLYLYLFFSYMFGYYCYAILCGGPMGNGQYFTSFWQAGWLFHLTKRTPRAVYNPYLFFLRSRYEILLQWGTHGYLYFVYTLLQHHVLLLHKYMYMYVWDLVQWRYIGGCAELRLMIFYLSAIPKKNFSQ